MKLVSAVVAPGGTDAVHHALGTFGVDGVTFSDVLTTAPYRHWEVHRGHPFPVDLLHHTRIEVVTGDDDAADLVRIIRTAGAADASHVWVTPVESLVRIRTGERGADAL